MSERREGDQRRSGPVNRQPAGKPSYVTTEANAPWDRQPDESGPAWQAFAIFRDLPPGRRSQAEVARELHKSKTLIGRWCARYAWHLRATAHDRDLDQQWMAQTAHLRREAAERDNRLAAVMLSKVVQRLQSIDPEKLSARDCATWVDVATKVSRLALGDPTERVEHSGPGGGSIPVESLTPEERRARLEQLVKEGQRRLSLVPSGPRADGHHG